MAYFLKAVVPVADESSVRLALTSERRPPPEPGFRPDHGDLGWLEAPG